LKFSLVSEIPVSDVEEAQRYYHKYFDCKIEWLYPGKEIGAVSNGECAIFFRKRAGSFEPVAHWVYCTNVDESYKTLRDLGANIVDDIENKPWKLRQFTVQDQDGNIFYFHS